MRRAFAYLVHPARLGALGALGALALTVLMLAGRPDAPPEVEATGPELTIDLAWIGTPTTLPIRITANGVSTVVTILPLSGTALVVGEASALIEESTPPGYVLTDISCTGGTLTFEPSGGATFAAGDHGMSVMLGPTEHATCTFTNAERAIINVVKGTSGGDGTFQFITDIPSNSNADGTAPTNGGFLLATVGGAAMETFTVAVPRTGVSFDVFEEAPPGWELVSLICVAVSGSPTHMIRAGHATVRVSPGDEITCTYVNTMPAIINIAKNTVGGDGTFGFTTDIPDNTSGGGTAPTSGKFSLTTSGMTATETFTIPVLGSNTFLVTENNPPGWAFSALNCVVDNGGAGVFTTSSMAAITVGTGDEVTCTFTNETAQITIEKAAFGGDASFTFQGSNSLPSLPGSPVSFDGNAQLVLDTSVNTSTTVNVPAGTYSVEEVSFRRAGSS